MTGAPTIWSVSHVTLRSTCVKRIEASGSTSKLRMPRQSSTSGAKAAPTSTTLVMYGAVDRP